MERPTLLSAAAFILVGACLAGCTSAPSSIREYQNSGIRVARDLAPPLSYSISFMNSDDDQDLGPQFKGYLNRAFADRGVAIAENGNSTLDIRIINVSRRTRWDPIAMNPVNQAVDSGIISAVLTWNGKEQIRLMDDGGRGLIGGTDTEAAISGFARAVALIAAGRTRSAVAVPAPTAR